MKFQVQGQTVLIDEEDYKLIKGISWYINKQTGYVFATLGGRTVYMHRLILNAGEGQMIDHKNGTRTDNRRSNLRFCTQTQNLCNKRPYKTNEFGLKGVYRGKNGKFIAAITCNGKTHRLGTFLTAIEAARAYNIGAKLLHGDFARLNAV